MPTYSQVQLLRGAGLTFEEIGRKFGVSRQRIHVIFSGFRTTDEYRERKRHFEQHVAMGYKPRMECMYCEKEGN